MKVYEVPLTFAEHHLDILGLDVRWVVTGPLVLWLSRGTTYVFGGMVLVVKVFLFWKIIFFALI